MRASPTSAPSGTDPARLSPALVVLAVTLGAAATVFWRAAADPFALVGLALLLVGSSVAATLALAGRRNRAPTPTPLLVVPALAFVLALGLAAAFGRSPVTSLLGGYARYDGLVSWMLGLLVLLVVVVAGWDRPRDVDVLAWSATAAGVLGATYLLIQAAGLDPYEWLDGWGNPATEPTGLLGNPSLSGALLALAAPLTSGLAMQARRTSRPTRARWLLAAALLLGAGCVSSQSAGAVLALVVGLAVSAWLSPWGPRWLGPGLLTVGMVGVLAGIGLVVTSADDPPARRAETLTTAGWANGDPDADIEGLHASPLASLRIREAIWTATIGVIGDDPLTGVGPGHLLSALPAHRNEALGGSDERRVDSAHDLPLQVTATGGLVALAALLALVGTTAWTVRRGLPVEGDADETARLHRNRLAAFAGSLAAFGTQALFDVDAVVLWAWASVALGAVAVLGDPTLVGARSSPHPVLTTGRVRSTAPVLVAAVLAVAVTAGTARLLAADLAYREALDTHAATGLPQVAAVRMQRALDLRPTEPVYWSEHARLVAALPTERVVPDEVAIARHRVALADLEVALEQLPDDPYLLHDVARAWWARKRAGEADVAARVTTAFEEAAAADPHNWVVRADQGEHLLEEAEAGDLDQLDAARAALTRADELRPDDPRLYPLLGRLAALEAAGSP